MKISVRFFASYREKTGQSLINLTLDRAMNIGELKAHLVELFPALWPLIDNAVASINLNFAMDDEVFQDGDVVGFFPPVSGGSSPLTIIAVNEEPISTDEITAKLTLGTTGAVCAVTGLVRAETETGHFSQTSWLEYEAYIPMAEAKLFQIANEMRERWPKLEGVALLQRVGRINPGTASVLVACAASHRNLGIFDAAHYGIDRIKEIVPIWKKEVSPAGQVWVEGNYHPGKGD